MAEPAAQERLELPLWMAVVHGVDPEAVQSICLAITRYYNPLNARRSEQLVGGQEAEFANLPVDFPPRLYLADAVASAGSG